MTINSLASSASSALTYANRVSGTSSTSSTRQAEGVRPPPPDEGGGLIGAIADALKSIGVDGTGEADTAATASGTESDSTNAAQALGSFLENLMSALHAQNGEEGGTPPAYGEPPQGGPGMGGGPGKLSSDLQSLISALGDATGGTTASTDTDSTNATDTDSSVSALQDSFKSLLTALGGDGADSDTKLSSFLQTLSAKLPAAGSSGNLIDTTA